jgi:RNA polymerase sporulation-specific sigma factor
LEKNNQLLLQKALAGDENAKEQFMNEKKALIYSLLHRFAKGNQVEELFQVGCIGFMKAFNQFDLSYECHFSTYAVPVILGEMKRYFRDNGSIHISRSIKDSLRIVRQAQEELQQQGSYTLQDLSDYTKIEMNELIVILEARQEVASLQEEIKNQEGKSITLESQIEDHRQKDVTLSLSLHMEVAKLNAKEQLIVKERYQKGTRQEDIASMLNISQVQVSRLEKKILLKLRKALL